MTGAELRQRDHLTLAEVQKLMKEVARAAPSAPWIASTRARTCWSSIPTNASIAGFAS